MPRFAANLFWQFQEYPLLARFQAARDLGFETVECPLFYDHKPAVLAEACAAAGLNFLMFNSPPGDMAKGDYGLCGLPGREQEFKDSIALALDYTRALKSRFLHVLAGIKPQAQTREACLETYVENLKWTAGICAKAGVGVLIEPINTIEKPGTLISTTAQAVWALEQVGHANLAIQYDFHNAQLMEGLLSQTVTQTLPMIKHMQIAGVPGRTPPDEGEISYPHLLSLIDALGYDGWVGLEYRAHKPSEEGSTRAGLAWAKPYGLG